MTLPSECPSNFGHTACTSLTHQFGVPLYFEKSTDLMKQRT